MNPNAIELARWQLERDRAAASRFKGVFEEKRARMAASPLAYLRGAAPLFYRLIAEHAELREGPVGEGWLCGDAHIENFGAFRTDAPARDSNGESGDEPVVFDVNDFDEAMVGPWRFDLLRLVTSLILGGRELGADGRRSLDLAAHLVTSYVDTLRGAGASSDRAAPKPVARLLAKVADRSHRDLLADRTEMRGGRRRFKIGERYAELSPAIEARAPEAFARYVAELGVAPDKKDRFDVIDVAFRIAGTGSLGGLRIAVLTRGKGGDDGGWLFDMKEEGTPSLALALPAPSEGPARRVLLGVRACLERPPRMLGAAELDGTPLVVRRLSPQDDKLDLRRVDAAELDAVAEYLGALLGRAHRRGAVQKSVEAWSREAESALVDRAIALAGVHEACYLAMCKLG